MQLETRQDKEEAASHRATRGPHYWPRWVSFTFIWAVPCSLCMTETDLFALFCIREVEGTFVREMEVETRLQQIERDYCPEDPL